MSAGHRREASPGKTFVKPEQTYDRRWDAREPHASRGGWLREQGKSRLRIDGKRPAIARFAAAAGWDHLTQRPTEIDSPTPIETSGRWG